MIAAGGFDGKVLLIDAADGKLVKEFVPVPIEKRLKYRRSVDSEVRRRTKYKEQRLSFRNRGPFEMHAISTRIISVFSDSHARSAVAADTPCAGRSNAPPAPTAEQANEAVPPTSKLVKIEAYPAVDRT